MKYLLVMARGIKQSSLHLKVCVCFVVFMVLNYIAWVKACRCLQNPVKEKKSLQWYTYTSGGGGLPYERDGDDRRKFWIKPLKETNLGVAQPFFDP